MMDFSHHVDCILDQYLSHRPIVSFAKQAELFSPMPAPDFNFEVVTVLSDPLQRQLAEALHILDRGELNRKTEYNMNSLCRLEPNITDWDIEEKGRILASEKKGYEEKLKNFKEVMLKAGHCMPISKSCLSTPNLDIYRSHTSAKRKVTSMQQEDDSNLEGKGERKHMRFLF